MAQFREKMDEDLGAKLAEELNIQEQDALKVEVLDMRHHRFIHGKDYINKLSRIRCYKDVEIEGKKVLAKFSLKVKMDKCTADLT
jgi:hypothetical protein